MLSGNSALADDLTTFGGSGGSALPDVIVGPNDPRYPILLARGFNSRVSFSPEAIRVVYSADQVVHAVNEAVDRRIPFTVRSGGHCLDALVADPRFRMLIDVSPMNQVTFDPRMNAFAIGPGATLAEAYKALYLGWDVTVPGGVCPPVGIGGHTAGGGYGPLSRLHGVISDHLYAVEVVVVDRNGRAKVVTATSDPHDPNRDLWWAHTGGGGGNFGIVTKYWFRTPGVDSRNPSHLLPKPPARLSMTWVVFPWDTITEADIFKLVHNHGEWHSANSAPDSPLRALHSALHLNTKKDGGVFLEVRLDQDWPNADKIVNDYIATISRGVSATAQRTTTTDLWLINALMVYPGTVGLRTKSGGSNMRKPLNDAQISRIYQALIDPNSKNSCLVYLGAYGGQINALAPDATAMPTRDTIYKFWIDSNWFDPTVDAEAVAWTRQLYYDVHAEHGGAPVAGDQYNGSYINYPNIDMRDPQWNRSGVPWGTLYYAGNYPRLQQIKAKYDPHNIFQHAMSIEPSA